MMDAARGAWAYRYDSFEAFADAVLGLPVPWRLDRRSKRFTAAMTTREMGALRLGDVRFGPCTATQTSADAAEQAQTCLTVQLQGRQGMIWPDHEVVVSPSDLILWDNSRPMRLENGSSARAYNIWFPTHILQQRAGPMRTPLGWKISGGQGLSKILSDHVHSVFLGCGDLSVDQQQSVQNSTIDLISSCFRDNRDENGKSSRYQNLLDLAKKTISASPDLEELSPKNVADAIGVSVRTLQLAFASHSQTFSCFILSLKLDRARHALNSNRFGNFSITEIAHWFGFFDAAHFSRSFKARFGCTPSEFRKR